MEQEPVDVEVAKVNAREAAEALNVLGRKVQWQMSDRLQREAYKPIDCNVETRIAADNGTVTRTLKVTCEATQENDHRIGAMMDLAMALELLEKMEKGKSVSWVEKWSVPALVAAVIIGSAAMVTAVLTH